ncbi:MAG: hypothetical protein LBR10_13355 [Prevotellaceae bacterium]|jgi:hypothetical protein|nr:hypothetical protein [Prevotellaceae bacterium]
MKKIFLTLAFLCFYSLNISAQSLEDIKVKFKSLLNDFCELHYEDCFGGREYISKSLTVTDVEIKDKNTIRVKGKHRYLNYINISATKSYYADIYIGEYYQKITFHKQSEDVFLDTYWEECTRDISDD